MRLRGGRVRSFPPASPSARALTASDLGASLGDRATLVQFVTEYCAYCGPTRELLGEIAAERPGVSVVEVDAAERMDLARRLRVFTTPTVFVLGPDGTIAARSAGKPEKGKLAESVGSVMDDGSGGDRSDADE
ncbi:MAG: thioredoxin family protein [Nocardiopsaceae bacterium]|nr:thioredoxin family protein [Nocardiopsaceae bacterium]